MKLLLQTSSLQFISPKRNSNIIKTNNTIRIKSSLAASIKMTTSWRAPQPQSGLGGEKLKVYNSLTKSKVPFISKEPNKITWYNCGPTVYDASHMGHARNYVTQDILRRIVRDYFGYDVKFVMNVTDIDDKIIQRARQQHLLANLRSTLKLITQELIDQVRESLESYEQNTTKKLLGTEFSALEQVLQKAGQDSKWKAEMVAKEEKFGMWIDAMEATHKALTRAVCVMDQATDNSRSEAEQMVDGASEVLSKWLDQKYGSTVTDHAIFKTLAAYWEKSFFDDMATLGVEPPSVLTRVSDYVEEIVEYVQKIVERGFAYVHEGSVYFDVNAFDGAEVKGDPSQPTFSHCYAKLQPGSKANKKLMEEGEGALSVGPASSATDGKRSPADFALWKKSKPGEPAWESIWGMGRPGWHIECSVMASAILGDGMDIHSGGVDLMFPHHDNEMAQSEAYHNCPQWVNYFLHTGHLHIEGLKMSKSLKNFITIGDALKQNSARQLRLSFISQRWDLGMDFAESAMAEVRNQESTFNNFFAVVKALRYERSTEQMIQSVDLNNFKSASHPLNATFGNAQSDFHAALCDSFNTPEAMKQLLNLVTETNKYISTEIGSIRVESNGQSLLVISAIAAWISKMLRVFGLGEQAPVVNSNSSVISDRPIGDLIGWNVCDAAEPKAMEYLIRWSSFRDQARKTAREKMQKKTSNPSPSKATASLTEALNQLCQQQFRDHLLLLNLSPSEYSDPSSFFDGKNLHVDHLSEPLKSSLTRHLPVWYEFWNELYRLSQSDSECSPAQVLTACDQLRDEKLIEVGLALDDQDDGKALVKLLPVSMLIQAREEKQRIQRAKEMKEKKVEEMKKENERKRLEKLMKGKLSPEEMFKSSKEFSQFDQNGVPTHCASSGEEISKSKRKKLLKDWDTQKKLHADYLAWMASNPS